MAGVPPPYAPRDHAQLQANPPTSPAIAGGPATPSLEFSESTSVSLEWKLSGLRAMYDSTKGDVKSKCVKSAVFGDADNLWEVLWYPNSGVQGGEFASLYLSCVPTAQERDAGVGSKWTRRGLWWFRFEIKSLTPDERTGKIVILATKDASDHTFAVKTANWGWQQFAKRDGLFLHPTVLMADGFVILCTIQAQPQPPAGYWLGMGLPPSAPFVFANNVVGGRVVGSGGGLSAWSGGSGACGGVGGGVAAAGGVRRVVPRELVSSLGAMLDDPVYSDVEFIIPARRGADGPRKIYAIKKLLIRCEYFEAMFNGGFKEVEGIMEEDEVDEELDMLSDSDVEDETNDFTPPPQSLHLTTTTSRASDLNVVRPPSPPASTPHREDEAGDGESDEVVVEDSPTGGEAHADQTTEEDGPEHVPRKPTPVAPPIIRQESGPLLGPKKTRVAVKDAAWSTWWAVLYWIYTDVIYFAPLTSSFPPSSSTPRTPSHSTFPPLETRTRREWIRQWCDERGVSTTTPDGNEAIGPRPVSAKAVYRLADKLDLPALRIRAFQHICGQLTAQNIPAEVFSRFSSTFEDVRKVQVAYFLKHWQEIKKSDNMTQIWQQIRVGKHVGFEEVWPLIVSQLEFKQA